MVKTTFIEKIVIFVLLVISLLIMGGCTSYRFGDVSKAYCYSTNEEFRAGIKATLTEKGVNIGLDYCASVGFVDALIVREGE